MATKLHELTLQGFRSFEARTTIAFPESGLVLFQGPSGAGKSTVLMGIAYALGYSPYPATELKSWHGQTPMEVTLRLLDTVEGDANIVRGSTTALYTDKSETRGASGVNAKLPQVLGLDTDLLAALTYRPQKTPGLFLSKTNSEMQEFLTTLLQLHKYEEAIEASQEQVRALTDKVSTLSVAAAEASAESIAIGANGHFLAVEKETPFIEQVEEAQSFVEEQKQIVQTTNESLKAYKAEWEAKIKEVRAANVFTYTVQPAPKSSTLADELGVLIKQIQARLAKLEATEKERTDILYAAIKDAERQVEKYEGIRDSLPSLLKKKEQLEQQIHLLESAICPRCEQPWLTPNIESDLVQAREDRDDVLDRINDARNADLSINGWKGTIEQHKTELEKVDPKIFQFKSLLNEKVSEQYRELARIEEQAKVEEAKQEAAMVSARLKAEKEVNQVNHLYQVTYDAKVRAASLAQIDLANAIALLTKAQTALTECRHRNDIAKRAIADFQKRFAAAQDKAADLREKEKAAKAALSAEQDFLELLKTFLTSIFDEVLAEIAWNANEMLRNVPNVAHVTVGFRSESTTGKGTVKRALVPYVTIYGVERNPKTALSGGMATAVDLAVDLAVRKVIMARTGHKPGWLVLDECFEGLGIAEKEACMSLLQQAATDTLILVVDHMTEFKEMFNQRFTITAANGRSEIEQDDA